MYRVLNRPLLSTVIRYENTHTDTHAPLKHTPQACTYTQHANVWVWQVTLKTVIDMYNKLYLHTIHPSKVAGTLT